MGDAVSVEDILDAPFRVCTETVVSRLRLAVARLVSASPVEIAKAADVQRLLKIDAASGWQIYRLATGTDAIGVARYVPLPGSMERALRHAREVGFPEEALTEAAAAYEGFQRLVEHHAGDRETFNAMVASLGDDHADQIEAKDRRAYFRVGARIWGVQARTWYRCAIFHPGSDANEYEATSIRGCVGLRQLRHVPPVTLAKRASIIERDSRAPVESPPSETSPLTLLEEFCSRPLPTLQVVRGHGGWRDALQIEDVGRTGLVDCFAFDHLGGAGAFRKPETEWSSITPVNIPCEMFVRDMLVPKGWAEPSTLRVASYGNITDAESVAFYPEPYALPISENGVYLGNELNTLVCPSIPRCSEIVQDVLRRLAWDDCEYDLFRCQVRYPILTSVIRLAAKVRRMG